MGKILQFPNIYKNVNQLPDTHEGSKELIENVKRGFADEVLDITIPQYVRVLYSFGIDVEKEECIEEYILACEAIKSLILKSVGIYDPLQKVSEDLFDYYYDEEGNLTYTYKALEEETEEEKS